MSISHQLVVVIGLVEWNDCLLMMRRFDEENVQWHQKWEFPGGKIELHETPLISLHREIKEETGLTIHSTNLLGIHTHNWQTSKGIQQTFIILYHCKSDSGDVQLNLNENDAFIWEKPEAILRRENVLDGTKEMLNEFYLNQNSVVIPS